MKATGQILDETLRSLPVPTSLPQALPLVHVSIARWFKSIVAAGELRPTLCSVFGEELLYLFYGGVFYRPSNKPTRNASEMPLGFVFSPSLLMTILRLYPFDTGGIASGRFGKWSSLLKPTKEKFMIAGDGHYNIASKIVHHIFGSNDSYLHGQPDSGCKGKPDPIPELYDFYSDDLTPLGVDHRQCIIECQSQTSIPIGRELLWVGFPELMTSDFARLCAWLAPYIPQFYAYPSHVVKTPSEIAAQLETIAYEEVVKRFVKLPV